MAMMMVIIMVIVMVVGVVKVVMTRTTTIVMLAMTTMKAFAFIAGVLLANAFKDLKHPVPSRPTSESKRREHNASGVRERSGSGLISSLGVRPNYILRRLTHSLAMAWEKLSRH